MPLQQLQGAAASAGNEWEAPPLLLPPQAPLGLVIRLQRLSRTTAGASAVVQLCRQTAAARCQG